MIDLKPKFPEVGPQVDQYIRYCDGHRIITVLDDRYTVRIEFNPPLVIDPEGKWREVLDERWPT